MDSIEKLSNELKIVLKEVEEVEGKEEAWLWMVKHVLAREIEARIKELENLNILDMGQYYSVNMRDYDNRLEKLQSECQSLEKEGGK